MPRRPLLYALLAAALFGSATPASKVLLSGFTSFQLAGLLYLGATLGVAPAALRRRRVRLPKGADKHNQLRLLGAVIAGGICGPVLLLIGLRLAEATSVSLWLNFEVAATALLGVLLFRIGRLFPGCPAVQRLATAEHACLKHLDRIGRSAAVRQFDNEAIELVVWAHVRHEHTHYDELLAQGFDRSNARLQCVMQSKTLSIAGAVSATSTAF